MLGRLVGWLVWYGMVLDLAWVRMLGWLVGWLVWY